MYDKWIPSVRSLYLFLIYVIHSGYCHLGSVEHENPSPLELESQTLESKLSSLEKHLSASLENGSLGSPALEFEKSAKSEDIDSVSEKLHWEVARCAVTKYYHRLSAVL